MFEKPKIGQELLDVPMGDMIQQMAFAIAESQRKLDENSIDTAQMMGGLQTITNETTGEVTFEDSRVFFGKEKVAVPDAITLHNSTNDISLRQSIRTALTSASITFTEPNLVVTTNADLAALQGNTSANDPAKVYETVDLKYYKFVTAGAFTEVSKYSTTIATSTPAVGGFIYVPSRVSMLELGFSPTFYQFVDTIIEVKISIKYTQDGSQSNSSGSGSFNKAASHGGLKGLLFGGKNNKTITTSHVNAAYSQKYSYSAEGSSLLRTKLVPIPPPAILEERIRLQMEVLKDQPATTEG